MLIGLLTEMTGAQLLELPFTLGQIKYLGGQESNLLWP